jgi:hypothetical protein
MVQGSGGEYFVSAGSGLKAIHRVFERLGSKADDSAFHANLLQLLARSQTGNHNACFAGDRAGILFMTILRAVVDLGLESGASPQSTEQRAMRAICGYLPYAG